MDAVPVSRRHLLRWSFLAAGAGLVTPACSGGDTRPRPTARGSGPAAQQSPTGRPRFPASFAWGTATSAYQVEGAAAEDGRGPSVWDTFCRRPGAVRDGTSGAVAADQYHRFRDDIALMRSLGLTSYRFSVSWSRVLPAGRGAVNGRGLDYYRRLVDRCLEEGIAPVVTLWHWDTPQALQDAGGWASRDCAGRFADYAEIVFRALGDRVPTFLTLNEPKTVVQVGYLYGAHAPGLTDPAAAGAALHHLLLGHGRAVEAYRASGASGRIGPCLNLGPVYPADDSAEASAAVRVRDNEENRFFLDPVFRGRYPAGGYPEALRDALDDAVREGDLAIVSRPVDLLGVNYYTPFVVDAAGRDVQRYPVAEPAEWLQVHPEGLYDLLTRLTRDYAPRAVMISENGRPDAEPDSAPLDDPERVDYLREHLRQAARALDAGVPLEGFHAWSFVDNFEWAEGYGQRWGLVHLDRRSGRRTLKRSARWYRDVVAGTSW